MNQGCTGPRFSSLQRSQKRNYTMKGDKRTSPFGHSFNFVTCILQVWVHFPLNSVYIGGKARHRLLFLNLLMSQEWVLHSTSVIHKHGHGIGLATTQNATPLHSRIPRSPYPTIIYWLVTSPPAFPYITLLFIYTVTSNHLIPQISPRPSSVL